MKKDIISKELYVDFQEARVTGRYCNFITNTKAKLGSIKTFTVEDTDLEIDLQCSQIGGCFTGGYVFVLPYKKK
jgi:hypothetical protein